MLAWVLSSNLMFNARFEYSNHCSLSNNSRARPSEETLISINESVVLEFDKLFLNPLSKPNLST